MICLHLVIVAREEAKIRKNNKNNKGKEIWPNFFIVGAPRAGTTSLYEYLRKVHRVYMPVLKEPHYFSSKINRDVLLSVGVPTVRDKNEYLKLYENVNDEIAIGDASTSYLWDSDSPKTIHDVLPEARIIMILRDPVERTYSHYSMNICYGFETLSFYDALRAGCYYNNQLKKGLKARESV